MRRLVVNPETAGAWEIPLAPGVISLGRNPENNFPIEHPSISGEHCLITVTDLGVTVKDLGSTNGTFVNDTPVDETQLLPGQILRLGDVLLRLELNPAPSAANPAGEAVTPASRPAFCTFHRHSFARYFCPKCERSFCSACVSVRQGGNYCRTCAVECEPLAEVSVADESELPFVRQALNAFAYPLQGDGVVLLAGGAVFFLVLNVAEFFLRFAIGYGWVVLILLMIFGAGYLTMYLRQILVDTAAGENRMPDWPEFSDFGSVASPFFQLLGTVLFSFGPAIALAVYGELAADVAPWFGVAMAAALVFGCVYFPMAFMAVAMFDSVGAMNPAVIIPSILRIPFDYALTVVLFVVILLVRWAGQKFVPHILPVPILPGLLSGFLGIYFLAVEARILGLLFWRRRADLGWFRR